MKTAAKVFIWIGMILFGGMIFPIVVGVFALKKLDEAPKEEVTQFGVITLFFCSFVGGLLMILLANEASDTCNAPVVQYEKEPLSIEEQKALNASAAGKTRIGMYALILIAILKLIVLIALFALGEGIDFWEGLFFKIFTIGEIIALVVPISVYFYNKQWLNKSGYIVLLVCLVLFVAFGLLGFSLSYLLIWQDYGDRGYYNYTYQEVAIMNGLATFAFILFLIATVLYILLLVWNRKILHTTKKHKIVKSVLEVKLAKIDLLLANGTITQNEYDKLREGIITKYY